MDWNILGWDVFLFLCFMIYIHKNHKATILQLITVNYMHHPIAIKFFFGQKKAHKLSLQDF